jgi:hypothetical protein
VFMSSRLVSSQSFGFQTVMSLLCQHAL